MATIESERPRTESAVSRGVSSPRASQTQDETKLSLKTTEFWAMGGVIAAILIAAAVSDSLDDVRAWTLVTIVAAAYIISRGLAKAGSRYTGGDDPLNRNPANSLFPPAHCNCVNRKRKVVRMSAMTAEYEQQDTARGEGCPSGDPGAQARPRAPGRHPGWRRRDRFQVGDDNRCPGHSGPTLCRHLVDHGSRSRRPACSSPSPSQPPAARKKPNEGRPLGRPSSFDTSCVRRRSCWHSSSWPCCASG